jgi:drug/metabolite transporter (DMT)-like permease
MTRKGWLLFIAISVIWGMPYLFIKIAVRELDPVVVVFARAGIAAAVLLPLAVQRKMLHQMRGHWRMLILFALVHMVGPFLLIGYGEQHISSSLTSLLIAASPLMVAVLALGFVKSERVNGPRLIGLLIGLAGLVILLGFDVGGDGQQLLGVTLVLLAVVGYAVAPLLLKHSPLAELPRLTVAVAECSITACILLPGALLRLPTGVPHTDVLVSLLVLGLICTAVALLVFYALIAEVGASRGVVFTYVNPAISVLLGVLLLRERFTIVTVAGFMLIIAGSWLSTTGTIPFLPAREGAKSKVAQRA